MFYHIFRSLLKPVWAAPTLAAADAAADAWSQGKFFTHAALGDLLGPCETALAKFWRRRVCTMIQSSVRFPYPQFSQTLTITLLFPKITLFKKEIRNSLICVVGSAFVVGYMFLFVFVCLTFVCFC